MGCSSSVLVSESSIDRNPGTTQAAQGLEPQNLSQVTQQKRVNAIARAEALFAVTQGQKFHDNYVRTTLVSYGANSKVLTAVHRTSGKRYAAKAIPKDRHNPEKQYQNVLHEVGVMKEVEDHPNAIQLFEVYNDVSQFYLVMEFCGGGELFDHISKSLMGLTERQAAQILRAIMQFLNHMHSKGIAHMDIKPENIMFDSEGAGGILKIIDFGASVYLQPDEHVRDAFGTVRYSSPEMANDVGIGQKTDVWSAGVVMYLMLCGSPPFIKSSDIDTLNYIKKAPRPKFSSNKWGLISPAAKDCIRSMLEPDAAKRPTAAQVLNFPWLRSHVHDYTLSSDIINHLRTFANQSRMRRMLLGLMAANLTGTEANKLLNRFYVMDADSSGTIELPELVQAAQKVLPDISEAEVSRVFSALDVDHTGTIDLREFFAGLIHTMDAGLQSSLALKSFTALDTASEGFVRQDVFVTALVTQAKAAGVCTSPADEELLRAELKAEFKALDLNSDGVLSFDEYHAVLHNMNNSTLLGGAGDSEDVAAAAATTQPIPVPNPPTLEESGSFSQRNPTSPRRVLSSRILAAAVDAQHDSLGLSQNHTTASHQNLILLAMEVQGRAKSGVPQSNTVSRCPSGTRGSSRRNSIVGLPGSGLLLSGTNITAGQLGTGGSFHMTPPHLASDSALLGSGDVMGAQRGRDVLAHANTDGQLLNAAVHVTPPMQRQMGKSMDGHEAISAVAMLLERQRRVSNSRQLLSGAGSRRMSTDAIKLGTSPSQSGASCMPPLPIGSPVLASFMERHSSRPASAAPDRTSNTAPDRTGPASATHPLQGQPATRTSNSGTATVQANNSTSPQAGLTDTPADPPHEQWQQQYEVTPFELLKANEEEWCILESSAGGSSGVRLRDGFAPCLSTVASSALEAGGLSLIQPSPGHPPSPHHASDASSSRPGTLQTTGRTSLGSSGVESSNSLALLSGLGRNSGSTRSGQLGKPGAPSS